MKQKLAILCFLYSFLSFGQSIDSLVTLDYDTLLSTYNSLKETDLIRAKPYVKAILEKTKKETSATKITSGYRLMAYYYYESEEFEKYISYIDSAIVFGKNAKYKYYPTSLYVNKGTCYDEKRMV